MKRPATNRRISLLAAAFLILLAAALARAVWLQVIRGPEYAAMALRQHRETVVVPASQTPYEVIDGFPDFGSLVIEKDLTIVGAGARQTEVTATGS